MGSNVPTSIHNEVHQVHIALAQKPEVVSLSFSQDDEGTCFNYLTDWLHLVSFFGLAAWFKPIRIPLVPALQWISL
jgi:hypothetical protein